MATVNLEDVTRPPLRPEVVELLEMFTEIGLKDFPEMTPDEARQTFIDLRVAPDNLPQVDRIENRSIDGPAGPMAIRIYRPADVGGDSRNRAPTLVWFHGGGWVLGDLETSDLPCRVLAGDAGCVVVSVDYRLAPEHPFPAAFDDCLAATRWARAAADQLGLDPERLAVGGDSAGGNLAAAVAIAAAAEGIDLHHQLLVYPVVEPVFDSPGYRDNGEGYFLTRRGMEWFWNAYTEPDDHRDPRVVPTAADLDALASTLAPAWVFTAGYDPLCSEGQGYADRLEQAGVRVTRAHMDDVIHGVFAMTLACSDEARTMAARALADAFSG
jgi:acetyl esterase